jgi:hypothetical protein
MLRRVFLCLIVSFSICFSFAVPHDIPPESVLEFFRSHANTALQTLDLNVQDAACIIQIVWQEGC